MLIEAALLELTLDDAYRLAAELGVADDAGLVNDNAASGFGFTTFGLTTSPTPTATPSSRTASPTS